MRKLKSHVLTAGMFYAGSIISHIERIRNSKVVSLDTQLNSKSASKARSVRDEQKHPPSESVYKKPHTMAKHMSGKRSPATDTGAYKDSPSGSREKAHPPDTIQSSNPGKQFTRGRYREVSKVSHTRSHAPDKGVMKAGYRDTPTGPESPTLGCSPCKPKRPESACPHGPRHRATRPPSVGNFKYIDINDPLTEVPVNAYDSWDVVKRVDWHSGRERTTSSPRKLPSYCLSDTDGSISPISLALSKYVYINQLSHFC